MRIVVCIKIVEGELNPFDACALEAALRIEGGEVTVLSMSPLSAAEKLRALTRLGVKEVILLSDKLFAGSDTLATSYILSKQLQKMEYDLILCGRQSIDGDTAQVGPALAAKLGLGLITNVLEITSLTEQSIACHTRMGEEEANLPALLTVERINTLRFPSIRSRLGEITVIDNAALGADPAKCGLSGSPTRVLKVTENRSGLRKCRYVKPEELKNLLKELSKADQADENTIALPCEKRMKSVVAVGDTVLPVAEALGETVTQIAPDTPEHMAEAIRNVTPDAVLWNADLWGRKYAPMVAAMLDVGLCADCTSLETDGEQLVMIRPAKGGNVMGRIVSLTKPQMATVRCETQGGELMLAGGRGVAEQYELFCSLAKYLGAEIAASRALVDKNVASYSAQVGLTGKRAAPRIYLAIGISGAVQHTCAIEGAGAVIAVNPDRNAPIFAHADYGVIGTLEDIARVLMS